MLLGIALVNFFRKDALFDAGDTQARVFLSRLSGLSRSNISVIAIPSKYLFV